jgi:Protein of unknown function (DUF1570)
MGGQAGGPGGTTDRGRVDSRLFRRDVLKGAALALLAGLSTTLRAQAPRKKSPLTAADEKTAAAVRDKAKKAGLGEFEVRSTGHFLGVGDGPAAYSARALELCESIATDYLAHFRKRGFKVDFPAGRLTVVTLKDSPGYQAFYSDGLEEGGGGHYDQDANWLAIFDFRPDQAKDAVAAKRYNTFTLAHETIHLLCFNTGLLPREADVPACIGEGLATYGEMWTPPRSPSAFGGVNRPRLIALVREAETGTPWIPISRLWNDDNLFHDPQTDQLAYAEAWVLVHYLLETDERLPKFQAYLAGLPKRTEPRPTERLIYAGSQLGSLDDLDAAVRRHAQRMARKAGLRLPASFSRARG